MIAVLAATILAAGTIPAVDDSALDCRGAPILVPPHSATAVAHWQSAIMQTTSRGPRFVPVAEDSIAGPRGMHFTIPEPGTHNGARWWLVTTWATKPGVERRSCYHSVLVQKAK